jgi:hypothetical protein
MPIVNLPGWDPRRTDNDPKQVFGAFAQSWINSGKPWNADAVRAFVAQDPRWELSGSATDPQIRVKQSELDKWKPGTSIWQDVIRDAGGANGVQFLNAGGAAPSPTPTAARGSSWWDANAPTALARSLPASAPLPLTPALDAYAPRTIGDYL